jgi:hypothetical protein
LLPLLDDRHRNPSRLQGKDKKYLKNKNPQEITMKEDWRD